MFPEYSDRISSFVTSDRRFGRLLEKHGELDRQIRQMAPRSGGGERLEALKKRKLAIKDAIYARLCRPGGRENRPET